MTSKSTDLPQVPARIRAGLAFVLLMALYEWSFGRFFPNQNGNLGHDFSYTLTEFLAGDYWFHENGPFAVPWFTPAFCGGRPFYADPQSMYYSLGQWLSFVVDPLQAVHASLLVMAAAGFWGTWLLARRSFGLSEPASLLASTVFMLNGFYSTRMIVGHYPFHSIMLLPLLAWLLLGQRPPAQGVLAPPAGAWSHTRADAIRALLAGLVVAYMIQSGLGTLLAAAMLAVLLIALVALRSAGPALLGGAGYRVVACLAVALAISAARLDANFALLGQFSRSELQLPGFDGIIDALRLCLTMLFIAPVDIAEQAAASFRNLQLLQGRHELEFGVTIVPLLALAVLGWKSWSAPRLPRGLDPDLRAARLRRITTMLLVLCLLVPIALNVYEPAWNAVLKKLPLIGSSSTLVRWFFVYIPVLAVVSGLAVDALPAAARARAGLAGTVIVAVLVASHDNSAYQGEPYPPKRVQAAAERLARTGQVPPVASIGVYRQRDGTVVAPLWRNDSLGEGSSQFACYYPTFGYGLEHFPIRDLMPGPTDMVLGSDHFNLKNPACYVFPRENACTPGDHFTLADKARAADFVRYRQWQFAVPARQQVAEAVSLATLVATLAALVALGLQGRTRRPRVSAA